MNSRVHPKYKTRYRVTNWAEYHQAIETALTLLLIFRLPLRQAEGSLRSLFDLMGLSLEAPDHTTVSRRSKSLKAKLVPIASKKPIHLIIDGTGLSIVGEGEWAAAKHGGNGRRGWKQLHLGVDACGEIVAQVLTDSNVADGRVGVAIIDDVGDRIQSATADAAYDTRPISDAAEAKGAEVVVPPSRRARTSRRERGHAARDQTMKRVRGIGRRKWKKESGYHRQRRVENTFFRYKTMIGERLRARTPPTQETEATVACNVLNRMRKLGWPTSVMVVP